jgi:hypothetical protein
MDVTVRFKRSGGGGINKSKRVVKGTESISE